MTTHGVLENTAKAATTIKVGAKAARLAATATQVGAKKATGQANTQVSGKRWMANGNGLAETKVANGRSAALSFAL